MGQQFHKGCMTFERKEKKKIPEVKSKYDIETFNTK
jgi:hypothetical protein